jgi:maleamate amidohydrolase
MESDLELNYSSVYGHKIGFGTRPALILIDFVQAYFDHDCELFADVEKELASALRIRGAARSARGHVPIILTRLVVDKAGNAGRFIEKVPPLRNFFDGSAMGGWPKGLLPADGELVISKQYPSAFFGTSLASTLTAKGIDTLIITGLTTSGCVRATCVDCISHGFIPIVVRDACGDRHADPHNANLFDMHAKYGDVVSEREAIAYLDGIL